MDKILIKYLLQEATEAEQRQVAEWIAAKEENAKYFDQLRLIWEESRKLTDREKVDEHAAWERFKERVSEKKRAQVKSLPGKKRLAIFRAAAGIAALLLCSWMIFYMNTRTEMILLSSGAHVRTDTLPDGSVITLNTHSSICFPEKFSGRKRSVQLEGEAFFNIKPDKERPFDITVDDVHIKVVGTSFNVKNTEEQTEVIVETGIVTVTKKKNKVKLTPHQKVIVTKETIVLQVEKNDDELYSYYRTKVFVCNNTPLYRLVEALNKAYSSHIVIAGESAKTLPLTTTFREEPLHDILSTVAETFHLNIEYKGDTIIIR